MEDQDLKISAIQVLVDESIKRNLLSLNAYRLKKSYPKTFEKLSSYITNKTELPESIDEDTIVGILAYSPSIVLYDFFDQNKIFVNICGREESWYFTIECLTYSHTSGANYKSRVLAEVDAIDQLFSLFERLENQQTKQT